MRKLGRLFLWVLGAAVIFAAVVLIGVNLYVQSQSMHNRIEQELSQRLNTPLRLRQISVTPWNGLKLNGITIPQEHGGIGGDFLRAQSFQLRVQFWSLFSNRLVITQVSLIKPEVVWAQNATGRWRLPALPAEQSPIRRSARPAAAERGPASPALASPRPVSTRPVSPNPPNDTKPPNESMVAPAQVQSFTPEVRRVNLKDGNFTFLDSAGRVVAKFIGIDFRSAFRTATAIRGNTSIERISIRDRFFIERLESPLHYDPAELGFSNVSAQAAGGELSGRFDMKLQVADSPFTASVKFRDLQAEQLMTNAGGPAGMIQGRLEGYLDATGKTADSNALAGKGEIILRDGKVQQYSLLVALGQILQIDELTQLHLEQAQVNYHISPGIVTIDQLVLRSPNIRLSAIGTISFSGKLHLESQLALNDKVRRQLFAPIRENFQPINDPAGYAAVDFKVSGTVQRPKTDLMDKVVGHDLRDLGSVISSLFGHAKKKKPRAEPTPSAAPSAPLSPNAIAPSISPNDLAPSASPNETTPAASVGPSPLP